MDSLLLKINKSLNKLLHNQIFNNREYLEISLELEDSSSSISSLFSLKFTNSLTLYTKRPRSPESENKEKSA
jgi:hypothetical protein